MLLLLPLLSFSFFKKKKSSTDFDRTGSRLYGDALALWENFLGYH
jgi:hypothetical protein